LDPFSHRSSILYFPFVLSGKGAKPAQIREVKKEAVEKQPKKTPKPTKPKKENQSETRPRSARTQNKPIRYIELDEEEDTNVPQNKLQKFTRDTETVPKPSAKTKPAKNKTTVESIDRPKKTTADKLLDRVIKQQQDKAMAQNQPAPTCAKVKYDFQMMNNNWLMKKFIDSSIESAASASPARNHSSDFNHFESQPTNSRSVTGSYGVSENDKNQLVDEELPCTSKTFTRQVSETSVYVQKTTTAPHTATVTSKPITTTATTNSRTRCIATFSKRVLDDSSDLVTTEIFEQNIKRTKFSTPKPKTVVFNVEEKQNTVPSKTVNSSVDRRVSGGMNGNDYTMSTLKKGEWKGFSFSKILP
jgi:hypothetical protein